MIDKQKLTELYSTVVDLLSMAWAWLKSAFQSLTNPQPDGGKADKPNKPEEGNKPKFWLYVIFGILMLSLLAGGEKPHGREIPYSQFLSLVSDDKVDKAVVTQHFINGSLREEDQKIGRYFFTIPLWDQALTKNLQDHKVEYVVRSGDNWLSNILFNWIIPIAIFAGIWMWLLPRMTGGAGRSFLNIGNKVRIQQEAGKITFGDVAGSESAKQELKETIEFLKSPEKLQKLGGRMPKGVLLVGAPGTGKTL
ncbi:MAG: ATP-dependent metallopeptidase FtsH/Yme1/Tma family protein, partial [Methylomonas sp.]